MEESGKRRDPLLELVNAVLDEVVTNQSHVAALSDEVHIMSMEAKGLATMIPNCIGLAGSVTD